MRRFWIYFNALLLGAILGMLFLAIAHTIPQDVHASLEAVGRATAGFPSLELKPVQVGNSVAALEHKIDVVRTGGCGNRCGDCCPCLPAAGHGNVGGRDQRTGGAVEVELKSATRSCAGSPHIDDGNAAAEVDVFVMCPIAVVGISEIVAAVGVRSRFGLESEGVVVARGLDLLRRGNVCGPRLASSARLHFTYDLPQLRMTCVISSKSCLT